MVTGTLAADEPVLLATKLHPPVRRGLLPRPAWSIGCARPRTGSPCSTPRRAGGKTSLLAEWCSTAEGVRVAWLTLDAGDDDPVLFWSYVVATLRRAVPEVGEQALRALAAGGRALREAAVPSLVNDLVAVDGTVVLVLDDYHAITNAVVHVTVALLVDRLPGHVDVVVTARGDPPFPLGRLRAAGELQELRTGDLAFDTEEVAGLLATVPVVLGAPEVERLARRTEGWPAGVALAAASLVGRDDDTVAFVDAFTGTDRYALDYLGTEVLAGLPTDLREFVLRTSILRRLSPASCAAVTGRADAAALLDRAERCGVFLSAIDPDRRWFRYHRLFRQLLHHQLTLVEPEQVATLHRRAALWSVEVGAIGDAVAHHVAAGEGTDAAALVAAHWNEWFNLARLGTVAGWLDLLPVSLVRTDPRLCVARAWLLLDQGSPGRGRPLDRRGRRRRGRERVGAARAGRGARHPPVQGRGSRREPGRGPPRAGAGRRLGLLRRHRRPPAAGHRRVLEGGVRGAHPTARRGRTAGPPHGKRARRGLRAGLPGAGGGRGRRPRRRRPAGAGGPGGLRRSGGGRALRGDDAAPRPRHPPRGHRPDGGGGRCGPARAGAGPGPGHRRPHRGGAGCGWRRRRPAASRRGPPHRPLLPRPGPLPARLARLRLAAPVPAPEAPAAAATALSDREQELLPLLAGTLSQREIGAVLHLSLNTVKTHSRLLFRKLGVSSRAEAVARARAMGLLPRA